MPKDKYSALWISHSRLSDFVACPRAYFLKNEYKDPKTNRKLQIVTPPLSLGSVVHEVIDGLSVLPTKTRFAQPLPPMFETAWNKVSGRRGGFLDADTEYHYKQRGVEMIKRINNHPGPLANLAVKIDMDLPYFWLSEEENIILCGKIDWLEYLPETNSVHIIDFKTSKSEEDPESLQLPIYYLLANACQNRQVEKMSYWYLGNSDELTPKALPDTKKAQTEILNLAKQIKLAKKLSRFKCPTDGCRYCEPLERVVKGEGEPVGVGEYGQDLFILPDLRSEKREGTVI